MIYQINSICQITFPINHEISPSRSTTRENVLIPGAVFIDTGKRRAKNMLDIKPQYIVSDDNEPVGVILDIQTFHKIEAVIEDYGLAKLMDEADDEEPLSLSVAHNYYANLKKKA